MLRLFSCLLLLGLLGCQSPALPLPDDYEADLAQWRTDRLAELIAPRGWLSLIGLHWLQDGANTFGSAADNPVRLPAPIPAQLGRYTLQDSTVRTQIIAGDSLLVVNTDSTEFRYGPIEWLLIERGDRWGVRVRDTTLPTRITLEPIDYFTVDPRYRVAAAFTPAATQTSRRMRNALGMEYDVPVLGTLRFRLRGKSEQLLAMDGGPDQLFLVFSDATTGETTYGGGRYLYCPVPDNAGQTVIDFNRAYNPPCVFTDFATCLLPLPDNHLELALEVGEKNYGHH
jgi:hypothetical protein